MNDINSIFDFLGKDSILLSMLCGLLTVIITFFTRYFIRHLIETKEKKERIRIVSTSRDVKNLELNLDRKKHKNHDKSRNGTESLNSDDTEDEAFFFEEDKNFNAKKDSLKYLKQQIHTDTLFKKVSFYLAVIMAITGTTILFGGSIACFFLKNDLAWITAFSGALTDIIATVFFWLINKTAKEVRLNNQQLERIEDFFAGVNLIERIENQETKDKTYQETVYRLIETKNSNIKSTNEEK
jgi:amino acid permease